MPNAPDIFISMLLLDIQPLEQCVVYVILSWESLNKLKWKQLVVVFLPPHSVLPSQKRLGKTDSKVLLSKYATRS